MLLNSPESLRFATLLAERVAREAGPGLPQQIEGLFQFCLTRSPNPKELRLCTELVRQHSEQYQRDGAEERANQLAFRDLCRAILNLNEFVYID